MQKLLIQETGEKVFNLFLRGLSSISKLALLIFIAKYHPLNETGIYGIIIGQLALGSLVIGYDFYSYSNREIVNQTAERDQIIFDSFYFYKYYYLLSIPFVTSLFLINQGFINYLPFFLFLLISEHLSQELVRILVSEKRNTEASIAVFIKQFMPSVSYVIYLYISSPNLYALFSMIIISSIFSFMYSYQRLNIKIQGLKKNLIWIKKGVKLSTIFILSTVCLRFVSTFDKTIINQYFDETIVGIYSFLFTISMSLNILIEVMVINFGFKDLISSGDNVKKLKKTFHSMVLETFFYGIFFIIFLNLIFGSVIDIVDKPLLGEYLLEFNFLILIAILFSLSSIQTLYFYSKKYDSFNLIMNFIFLSLFISTILIVNIDTLLEFIFCILISYVSILLIKGVFIFYDK